MITITESSNWLAQHSVLIGILACAVLTLAATIAMITIFTSYVYAEKIDRGFKRKRKIALSISCVLFLVAMSLLVLRLSISEAHYSGSEEYTVKQSETQSSGQQIITVNDSKSDVKLNVDDDGKTNYAKGDKVEVSIQSDDSANHGKHYLSDVLRSKSNKGVLIKTEYTLEKID